MAHEPLKMDRPRIGLALSGGAARGISHIGVLRSLEEDSIPIERHPLSRSPAESFV